MTSSAAPAPAVPDPVDPATTPLRHPERMRHNSDTVHAILDEALCCHVAYVTDGRPMALPTVHVRVGDTVYLHGSSGSRLALAAADSGVAVSVAATLLDGLVFARAQANHSAAYRSVVAHGTAHTVTDEATKLAVSDALVDKLADGRSAQSRPPTRKELASVAILAVRLDQAAAKIRPSTVGDDEADLDLPYWAGVLPLSTVAGDPVPATPGPVLPGYLHDWHPGRPPKRGDWLTAEPMTGNLVRLEPLSLDHVDDLYRAAADPQVWRWMTSPPPVDRRAMAEYVVDTIRAGSAGDRVSWAQVEVATGRAVGMTSCYDLSPAHRRLEIGFTWLGRPWWRTGINTEAKLLLLRRAFDRLGARRVSWRVDAANERSLRAVERLGARRDGVLRDHMTRPDGTRRDSVIYSMTAAEWPVAADRLRRG